MGRLAPGTRLGADLTLVELLGTGGLAETWLARDHARGVVVAKVLGPGGGRRAQGAPRARVPAREPPRAPRDRARSRVRSRGRSRLADPGADAGRRRPPTARGAARGRGAGPPARGRRAAARARAGHRPSRPQALEHPARRGRAGTPRGLRPGRHSSRGPHGLGGSGRRIPGQPLSAAARRRRPRPGRRRVRSGCAPLRPPLGPAAFLAGLRRRARAPGGASGPARSRPETSRGAGRGHARQAEGGSTRARRGAGGPPRGGGRATVSAAISSRGRPSASPARGIGDPAGPIPDRFAGLPQSRASGPQRFAFRRDAHRRARDRRRGRVRLPASMGREPASAGGRRESGSRRAHVVGRAADRVVTGHPRGDRTFSRSGTSATRSHGARYSLGGGASRGQSARERLDAGDERGARRPGPRRVRGGAGGLLARGGGTAGRAVRGGRPRARRGRTEDRSLVAPRGAGRGGGSPRRLAGRARRVRRGVEARAPGRVRGRGPIPQPPPRGARRAARRLPEAPGAAFRGAGGPRGGAHTRPGAGRGALGPASPGAGGRTWSASSARLVPRWRCASSRTA